MVRFMEGGMTIKSGCTMQSAGHVCAGPARWRAAALSGSPAGRGLIRPQRIGRRSDAVKIRCRTSPEQHEKPDQDETYDIEVAAHCTNCVPENAWCQASIVLREPCSMTDTACVGVAVRVEIFDLVVVSGMHNGDVHTVARAGSISGKSLPPATCLRP